MIWDKYVLKTKILKCAQSNTLSFGYVLIKGYLRIYLPSPVNEAQSLTTSCFDRIKSLGIDQKNRNISNSCGVFCSKHHTRMSWFKKAVGNLYAYGKHGCAKRKMIWSVYGRLMITFEKTWSYKKLRFQIYLYKIVITL